MHKIMKRTSLKKKKKEKPVKEESSQRSKLVGDQEKNELVMCATVSGDIPKGCFFFFFFFFF